MPPNATIQACLSHTQVSHVSQCSASLTMVNIFHSGQYFQYLQYPEFADATVQACLSRTHLDRDNTHTWAGTMNQHHWKGGALLWDGSSIIIDRVASNFESNAVVSDDAIKLARGELSCHPFISIIRLTMFNMLDNGQYTSQWSTCFTMFNTFHNVQYISQLAYHFQ